MTMKLLIGLDGHSSGDKALNYAMNMAKQIKDCELIVAYVVEWSPFSFQTAEENATRHKRREEEIDLAMTRVVDPAVEKIKAEGLKGTGVVRHGNVADVLDAVAKDEGADQILVCRSSDAGIASRIFGSAAANLVMSASVPVTVIN